MIETTIEIPEFGTLAPERVRRILQQNGLEVADERWALLERWAELLRDHNQRVNLVSRKEEGLIWEKHLLPSLALLCLREFPEDVDVCDFGTGGGLPGLPIAIVRPDVRVTLLDMKTHSLDIARRRAAEGAELNKLETPPPAIAIISPTAGQTVLENNATLTVRLPNNLSEFTSGLIAYYPFNGNANDESGNGNHGTVNGATLSSDRLGSSNSAYAFEQNDFIDVPASDSLNKDGPHFISLWVKMDKFPTDGLTHSIFAKGSGRQVSQIMATDWSGHSQQLQFRRLELNWDGRVSVTPFSELQESEFSAESKGYTGTKHQREVGTSYFDAVSQALTQGKSSTVAMSGSTEEDQF